MFLHISYIKLTHVTRQSVLLCKYDLIRSLRIISRNLIRAIIREFIGNLNTETYIALKFSKVV